METALYRGSFFDIQNFELQKDLKKKFLVKESKNFLVLGTF